MPYSAPGPFLGAQTSSAYQISRSLRFRSSASAYLNRTFGTPTNNTVWTWSSWIKRGKLSAVQMFLGFPTGTNYGGLGFNASDALTVWNNAGTPTTLSSAAYRDPSAFYHIVISSNGTTITGYVNGVSVGSYTGTITQINSAISTDIGATRSNGYYFDGYLAEVNFIDGQALTPSSFGAFDTNGVWQPAKYTGSYGTNGFYLPFTPNTTSTYALYQPDAASSYMDFPTGSQGTNFTFSGAFTVEGWVFLPSASSGDNSIYVQNDGSSSYFALNLSMSTGMFNVYTNSAAATSISHGMSANTWNHFAMVRNGSTITLYTNGVSRGTITNSATLGYSTLTVNRTGGGLSGARYLSNFRITKTAVYTSAFTPPTSPLTAVSNTVILTCQNATAVDNSGNSYSISLAGSPTLTVQYPFGGPNVVGNDASGVGNNWTSNNISLATGTTYDSMIDSPTNYADGGNGRGNYAVLNPFLKYSGLGAPTEGNLNTTANNINWRSILSSIAVTSGKWYAEVTIGSASTDMVVGVFNLNDTTTLNTLTTVDNRQFAVASSGYGWQNNGNKLNNNTGVSYNGGATYTTNNVIGIALDLDSGTTTLTFYKDGVSQGQAFTGLSGNFVFASSAGGSGTYNWNFGQRPFTYTPPSGFSALNTQNLPTPTIAAGNKYFDALLYTGNGSSQSISGLNFQPDFIWCKNRSSVVGHQLVDAVRTYAGYLASNDTGVEQTAGDRMTSFNSNGFSVGASGAWNTNSNSYVTWSWKANGSGSSNTSGSITSTVSANTTAGFSVVTYTGDGSASKTVGHGLNAIPSMVIIKKRNTTSDWYVAHYSLNNSYNFAYHMFLNTTGAVSSNNDPYFLGSSNTSSVIEVLNYSGSNGGNQSGTNYVAYCFAPVAGYSAFGSYTGNASTDGPFVYCGFRPRYILIKGSSLATSWYAFDTSRSTYNEDIIALSPSDANTEATTLSTYGIDILSNGFKIKQPTGYGLNNSAATYIYAAFAENPFKISRAR